MLWRRSILEITSIIACVRVLYSSQYIHCSINYMPELNSPSPRYGIAARGITARDVELAADTLLRAGERPTIEKIREKIGRGSPNTINPMLDVWWKRLAARLDSGPAALHRLPEAVLHVAEALWMQALDEARRRATQEITRDAQSAARTKDDLEIRSHVLTLREAELDSRLRERERTQATLESQLHELTLLLRKEKVTRDTQARRIIALEEQLLAHTQKSAKAPRRKVLSNRNGKRKSARAAKPPSGFKFRRRKPKRYKT